MPRLRPLRKDEDIARVPADQPVLIETAEEPVAPVTVDVTAESSGAVIEPVRPAPEPVEDDAATALAKQLDDLRKAEENVRRQLAEEQARRAAAEREAATRAAEARRYRDGQEQAQEDTVLNAIAVHQERLEAGRRQLRTARAASDAEAEIEAIEQISDAKAQLAQFETAKVEIERRREMATREPVRQSEPEGDPIDRMAALSPPQRDWLKAHRDALTDNRKNAILGGAHYRALDAGLRQDSPEYFTFLEEELGYRQRAAPEQDDDDQPQPKPRKSIVSAPVSRNTPNLSTGRSNDTRVELTAEERETAKLSGISDKEYAIQKLKLRDRKASGYYDR